MKSALLSSCLLILALSACTTPQTIGTGADLAATEAERERQRVFVASKKLAAGKRISAISMNVLVHNARQCGTRTKKTFGVTFAELQELEDEERAAATRAGRLTFPPTITAVVNEMGNPLQQADVVTAIDGEPISSSQVLRAFLDRADSAGQATFTVQRNGMELEVPVSAVDVCDIPVEMVWETNTNAFTDGDRIVINKGILDISESDDEVALVIAHELGHVASGHLEARRNNAIVGGAAGLIADIGLAVIGVNTQGAFMKAGANVGSATYSQDFEREADYVGAYFAHNAGYSVDAGKQVWRSMGAANPEGLSFAGTHPTSPERYIALDNAAVELEGERSDEGQLQPKEWSSKMGGS